ncbi:MAG TPA: hypothetical protein VK444_07815 [Methanobacteriaceae archaeon]|nr:hypothetical protein [Methanobacteriaceae archaeon]
MSKKKNKEEVQVIISLPLDGGFPVIKKTKIKKSKKKGKKRNVQEELDRTRLDLLLVKLSEVRDVRNDQKAVFKEKLPITKGYQFGFINFYGINGKRKQQHHNYK